MQTYNFIDLFSGAGGLSLGFEKAGFKCIGSIDNFKAAVTSHEYNFSNNVSTRKIQTDQHEKLANFATGSIWAPYVTTIGLYDDNHELLVVGKLGQPIRMSDETDTTFVVRWDT